MYPSEREEWFGILPEMPEVGMTSPRRGDRFPLAAHRHPGAWELCLLVRGKVQWWAGEGIILVPPGHAFVTRPDEEHGGVHDQLQRCTLYWVQLRPRAGRLPGTGNEGGPLLAAIETLPRTFPAADLAPRFANLLVALRRKGAHRTLAIRAALHALLVATVDAAHEAPPGPSPAIVRACDVGRAHLAEGIGVSGLARAAGLSSSRFHARFLAEIGASPADWLRRERIARAQYLLERGVPVTTVAHDLGFPSSQHFATVFRRYTGISPRVWAASG